MNLWLEERPILSPFWGYKIQIKGTIETRRTEYQEIAIYDSVGFGKVMTLDGVIQLTEWDEANYHEMLVHVPALSLEKPETALVIGGGDGGVVRELLKHPTIKEIHFCELDEGVVQLCMKHFPNISCGLKDPKVLHRYNDGTAYIKEFKNKFDIIIVDSSDPDGPNTVLFEEAFFRNCSAALTPKGILITQAESFNYPGEQKMIAQMFEWLPKVFTHCGYYNTMVPTYPAGQIGLSFLSNGTDPYSITPDPKRVPQGLKYYSAPMHQASFVLPEYTKAFIKTTRT